MKIIAIGGVPGTGKTTLIRRVLSWDYDWKEVQPTKLLPSLYSKELDCYIFGRYPDGEVFCGTDKLSMAVQPEAVGFIKTTESNVLFEGDRLFNKSFLNVCNDRTDGFYGFILTSSDDVRAERYASRGSNQSEKFINGRFTKYNNVASDLDLMDSIAFLKNDDQEDLNNAEKVISTLLR